MAAASFAVVAVVAASAYSAASENKVAKTQQIASDAATTLNTAQAQASAARVGEKNARSFRSALAQQVAVASQRGGAGSLMRQFSTESVHNFLQDQESIKQNISLHGVQAQNQFAQSAANRSATRMRGFANIALAGTQAASFSGFGGGGEALTPAQQAAGPGAVPLGGPVANGRQWVNPNL